MSLTTIGWLGQPREVATAALLLASRDFSYVTGTELFVTGGMGPLLNSPHRCHAMPRRRDWLTRRVGVDVRLTPAETRPGCRVRRRPAIAGTGW